MNNSLLIRTNTEMVKRFDYFVNNPKNDTITKRIYEQSTNTDKTDSATSTNNLPIFTDDKLLNTKSEILLERTASSLKYILDLYKSRRHGTNIANTNMVGTNLRSLMWESMPRVRVIPEPELLVAGNRDRNVLYNAAPLIYFIPFLCSLLGIQTNSIVYNTSTILATLDLIIKNLPLELTALRRFLRQAVSDQLLAVIVDALFFCYVLAYVFWSLLYDEQGLPREISGDTTPSHEELSNIRNIEEFEWSDSHLGSSNILQRSNMNIASNVTEIRNPPII